jgi:hypothetical protein
VFDFAVFVDEGLDEAFGLQPGECFGQAAQAERRPAAALVLLTPMSITLSFRSRPKW